MQHISFSDLESILNVGTVDVTVDDDSMGGYIASNMTMLASPDLGGDISVRIWDHELSFEGSEEFDLEPTKGEFEPGSVEMFVELLTRARGAFARFMVLGRLEVGHGGAAGLSDREDQKNLNAAIDSLGEDFFEIGLAEAFAARRDQMKREENVTAFFKSLLNLMREEGIRRGLNKEERDRLTIGEVLDVPDGTDS